jgi:hypothetical protein
MFQINVLTVKVRLAASVVVLIGRLMVLQFGCVIIALNDTMLLRSLKKLFRVWNGTFIYLDNQLYHAYNTPDISVSHAKMMSDPSFFPNIQQRMRDKLGNMDLWPLRNEIEKDGFTGRVSPDKGAVSFWNTKQQIEQRYGDFLE